VNDFKAKDCTCGGIPEYTLLKTGHTLICNKCQKIITGYRRKEWVFEQWNELN
jgi:hypothetical protein